jgi:hypothetical protein
MEITAGALWDSDPELVASILQKIQRTFDVTADKGCPHFLIEFVQESMDHSGFASADLAG